MSISTASHAPYPICGTFINSEDDNQDAALQIFSRPAISPEHQSRDANVNLSEWILIRIANEGQDNEVETIWVPASILTSQDGSASTSDGRNGASIFQALFSALSGASYIGGQIGLTILNALSQGKDLTARGIIHSVDVARDNGPAIQQALNNALVQAHSFSSQATSSAFTAARNHGPTIQVSFVRAFSYGQTISIQAANIAYLTAKDNGPTLQRALYTVAEQAQALTVQTANLTMQHGPALLDITGNGLSYGRTITLQVAHSVLTAARNNGPYLQESACNALSYGGEITSQVARSAAQAIPALFYRSPASPQPILNTVPEIAAVDANDAAPDNVSNDQSVQPNLDRQRFTGLRNGALSVLNAARSASRALYNASTYVLNLPVRAFTFVLERITYAKEALAGAVSNAGHRIYNAFR